MKKIITFVLPTLVAVAALAPLAQADTSMTASTTMMGDTVMASHSMMISSDDVEYGSTGDKVTALQTWLVKKGLLTIPAGVSMGYFGLLTQAALIQYQTSVGLPAHGYYGPLTRAKHSAEDTMMMHSTDSMTGSTSGMHAATSSR